MRAVADRPLLRLLATVIGRPEIAAPLESTALIETVETPLSGTVVAPEYESVVPTMSSLIAPRADPDCTDTVAVRLLRFAPAANVAVATPAPLVSAEALVSVPVSVENVTGTPLRLTLPAPLTTAETSTVSPPLPTWTALARTSTEAAETQELLTPDAAEAEEVEQAEALPNGEVPASPPPPPQPATSARASIASAHFNLFIAVSLDACGFNSAGSARRGAVGHDLGRQEDQQLGLRRC